MTLPIVTSAPSGEFRRVEYGFSGSQSVGYSDYPVFNPAVLDNYRGSYEAIPIESKAFNWLSDCQSNSRWQVAQSAIDEYADVAVRLTENLQAVPSDCRLGPLRGAARPCLLTEIMSQGSASFDFFNFQQGSAGTRDSEIRYELLDVLEKRDPQAETYRIQIVDTAIGGQGINKLVDLLNDIHEEHSSFRNQNWMLDINLLHPTNGRQDIANINRVQRYQTSNLNIDLKRYPVADLVVEDWDEAIGFTLEREGQRFIAKPSIHPGRFLLKKQGCMYVVDSADLSRTFDELFSEAITTSLLSDPNRELVRVVWDEYQSKG